MESNRQFVGIVPGVPATAPTIELLRIELVRASSTSKPLLVMRATFEPNEVQLPDASLA